MKFLIIIALTIIFSFYTNAQNPVYKNYNSTNGFFSSSTNCIIQDKKGVIWIGTKIGLSRFDGYFFKNYTTENGLIDNNIVDFFKDEQNRIWFISSNNNLGYIKNDSIFKYKYNSKIQGAISSNSDYIKHSLEVIKNKVEFAINFSAYITIDSYGFLKKYYYDDLLAGFSVLKKANNNAYLINSFLKNDSIFFSNKCIKNVLKFKFPENKEKTQTAAAFHKKNIFFANNSTIVCSFYNNSIKLYNVSSDIIEMKTINNKLFVSTLENGVFIFDLLENSLKLTANIFKDYIINYIIEDFEGGLWFSTINNGLLYIPDINRQVIPINKGGRNSVITDMVVLENEIYLSYSSGIVENINSNKSVILDSHNKIYQQTKLASSQKQIYALNNNKIYLINKNTSKILFDLSKKAENAQFNDIFVDYQNNIWVSGNNIIIKINNQIIENIFSIDGKLNSEITKILKSPEGLFIAVKNGLWKFSNNNYYNLTNTNKIFNCSINEISTDKFGFTTLISTNGNGLIFLAKDSVFVINKLNDISSNIINSSFMTDSTILIGTNKGVEMLILDKKHNILHHKIYNGNFNYTTNEVKKVTYLNGNIYYITNNNLFKIEQAKNYSKKIMKPNVYINKIEISNIDTIFKEKEPKLKYYENNITFNFIGISYKNTGEILYRYKLNEDNPWNYTTLTSVDYSMLTYGKYKFIVCAANADGFWGQETSFSFEITVPFYYTWWFISITFLSFFLLVFLIARAFVLSIRKKDTLQKDMLMYKQQALRKQMNPHFIFNALNSIQHFILQNDKKMSNRYLTRFSNLIRIILENSQKNIISIDEELSAIKLYLEIEALRFKDKLNYTIEISPKIDTINYKVPPLLFQPFLENSIWHGLMNINDNREGLLIFKMDIVNDKIICTIEDNGVGRYLAKEIKENSNRNYKSLASIITNERVELFNYENNKRITMRYIDKYNSEKVAIGTKVEITIPIIT